MTKRKLPVPPSGLPEGEHPGTDDEEDDATVKPARTTSGGAALAATIGMGCGEGEAFPTGGGSNAADDCLPPADSGRKWRSRLGDDYLYKEELVPPSFLSRLQPASSFFHYVTPRLGAAADSTSPPHRRASLCGDSAPGRALP